MLTQPEPTQRTRHYRMWLATLFTLIVLLSGTLVVIGEHQAGATSPSDFLSTVKSQQSQLCLDAPQNQTSALQQESCANTSAQLFSFQAVASLTNTYTLVNQASHMCVDVSGASQNNGAAVTQQSCNGNKSQEFQLRAVQDSYTGYPFASGSPVTQSHFTGPRFTGPHMVGSPVAWPTSTGSPVAWPTPTGSPTASPTAAGSPITTGSSFQLVAVNSGKCLDTQNGYMSTGTQIDLWTCANDLRILHNQVWQISGAPQLNSATPTTTPVFTATPASTTTPVFTATPTSIPQTPSATPTSIPQTPSATPTSSSTGSDPQAQAAQAVFAQINQERAGANLPALQWSTQLVQSAHNHNLAMQQANQLLPPAPK